MGNERRSRKGSRRIAYRPGDVLQLLIAKVTELYFDLVPHLAVCIFGNTDAARISNPFQSRGDIDAIAHQVTVALLNNIAQMDPDTELDATLGRKTGIALDHAILQLHCAAHSVHDASELDEDAVARPLNDAAVMQSDGRVDQIAAERA
jgi:hypothetical protein